MPWGQWKTERVGAGCCISGEGCDICEAVDERAGDAGSIAAMFGDDEGCRRAEDARDENSRGADSGESGGVRGRSARGLVRMSMSSMGGRYVMPIAQCKPVISHDCATYPTVISPACPFPERAGIEMRCSEFLVVVVYLGRVTTWSGLKCFQPLMSFAAPASARMTVLALWGSVLSVCSLQ
jgi:hypothetical protein